MPLDIARLEKLEEEARSRLDPASDDYEEMAASLSRVSDLIDSHYKRNVDDAGKLKEEPATRQPARVGEGDSDYFFEPNTREVQEFFKRDPDALDRLRDSRGNPLRQWAEGIAQEEIRVPVNYGGAEAMGPSGYHVQPAKTYLDQLTEEDEPYKVAAEEMWRLASEDAQKKGRAVKRYRDVKLDKNEWKDYIEGGIVKGAQRIIAPATLNAASSMSAGTAAPLNDAITDLQNYEYDRMDPEQRQWADALGFGGDAPSTEDVSNRSRGASLVGTLGGYALPGNPVNALQNATTQALAYGSRGVIGRAGAAAAGGGLSNAQESMSRDMARYANEGGPIPVGDVALNALGAGAIGIAGGGLFDLAGQGIGSAREGFRRYERNAPLRTLEEAGGRADVATGVAAPAEIQQAYNKMHSVDPNRPPTTAGGELAADLAPHIEQSVKKRAIDEQSRTAAEMEAYYNHPDYRDIRVSAKPAVEGMIEMAQRNMGRNSTTGSVIPMDPATVDQIGGILRDYSEAVPVTRAEGPALAHNSGGTIVPGELANRLYGYKEGDIGYFAPGQDALVLPIDVNAQNLTTLEQRIDRELNFAAARGNNNDPVWNRFNERVKAMRDEFPAYKDADGNLVAPPPDSARPEPFDLAADVPRPSSGGNYMAPPMDVGGTTPPKPEGLMGVGPDGPPIPDNPFDPRLPVSRGLLDAAMTPNRQVSIEGSPPEPNYIQPEALPGVGPNYNPRDVGPALPVHGQLEVRGQYQQPPMVRQPDIPGVGPRYNPRDAGQAMEPQPTQSVQGDYDKPPEIEPAPITERGMPPAKFRIMVMENGQPRPVAGMRAANSPEEAAAMVDTLNSYGTDTFSAEPIPSATKADEPFGSMPPTAPKPTRENLAAGDLPTAIKQATSKNGLALVADVVRAFGGDVQKAHKAILDAEARGAIELRPEGGLNRLSPEELQMSIPGPDKMVLSNIRVIDEPLLRNDPTQRINAPVDERGGLERSLDEQLEQAPKVPTEEIEEIGALQTADREQVAAAQKAYLEEHFAPGREARAAQIEKIRELGENPEIIEEAIAAVKKVDEHLGPIPQEQKRDMIVQMIEKRLGRKIDAEDLIRFGLISAGLVQMSTSDDDAGGSVGAGIFSLGLGGKGKKVSEPEAPKGPSKPAKPTQPEATLEDGRVVRGFSAMRNKQHTRQEAIEKAMKRLGVEGDSTLESRIRTYGQLDDRQKIDKALLEEASSIGKQDQLRQAAGANAYPGLRDRSWPGGSSRSIGNAIIDMLGVRLYRAGEYFSGRFNREFERNPFIRGDDTTSGDIQRALLQDPARRLLNLTGGGPAARLGGEEFYELLKGDSVYESKEEYEKKKQQKRKKEARP